MSRGLGDVYKRQVKQQYLPDPIKNAVYYRYGDNKVEQAAAKYWEAIKHADGH